MPYTSKFLVLLLILIYTSCTVTKTICPCEAPEIIRLEKKDIEINAQITLREVLKIDFLNNF